MNKQGPIIVVEDDADDREMLQHIFTELKTENEVIFLNDGMEAYDFLLSKPVDPFLIISDINMPRMSGIQLRDKIQQEGDITHRAVPFIFLTTAAAENTIINAYVNSIQGFFTKASNVVDFKRTIHRVIEYWKECTTAKNTK